MYLCKICEEQISPIKSCMGDGRCETHGRFAFYHQNLKIKCPRCAYLKNVCQRCGGVLDPSRIQQPKED